MTKLINIALRWMIRNFLSFFLIVFVLVVGNEIINRYEEYLRLPNPDKSWDTGLLDLESQLKRSQEKVIQAAGVTVTALKKRKAEIENKQREIAEKLKGSQIDVKFCLLGSFDSCAKSLKSNTEYEIENSLLTQEHQFVVGLLSEINDRDNWIRDRDIKRDTLNKSYKVAIDAEKKYIACVRSLEAKSTFKKALDKLLNDGCQAELKLKTVAFTENQKADKAYKQIPGQKLRPLTVEKKLKDIESNTLRELKAGIEKYRGEHERHIFSRISKKFENQFLTAALILIGAISTPIFIKLFFFYIVAPFAVRRPSITLMKASSGVIENLPKLKSENSHGVTISELTTSISVNKNEELLIKDDHISDLTIEGDRKTRFLFSHAFPITSLAAGLYALTQIRTDSKEVVNIQATHESLYEVGVLNIPEGTAVVLKPHKLIGLIQDKNLPIKITRHWRLGSLHAWLTLQLRYMVFHGPGKLILKGCKGIQVARADSGRAINQSATIGFTANVQYSNSRTETFIPYLNGKKELFNDSFHGDSGYYIYETMPYADQKGGLFGRGIEGLTDSVLKVFGI